MNVTDRVAEQMRQRAEDADPTLRQALAMLRDKSLLTNRTRDNNRDALALIQSSLEHIAAGDKPSRRAAADKVLRDYHRDEIFSRKLNEEIGYLRNFAESYLSMVDQNRACLEACRSQVKNLTRKDIGDWQVSAFIRNLWVKIESVVVGENFAQNFEQDLSERIERVQERMGLAVTAEAHRPTGTGYQPSKRDEKSLTTTTSGWDARKPIAAR